MAFINRYITLLCFVPILSYVPACVYGTRYMKNKEPADIRNFSVCWNLISSIMSLVGFAICVRNEGMTVVEPLVDPDSLVYSTQVVIACFAYSKILEFMDTVILVLSKKNLIFLHVYHHVATAFCCIMWLNYQQPLLLLCTTMNLGIHSLMYAYFTASNIWKGSSGIRKLRPVITVMQIVQMIVGTVFSVYAFHTGYDGEILINKLAILGLYISFLYLFTHFALTNYSSYSSPIELTLSITPFLVIGVCYLGEASSTDDRFVSGVMTPIITLLVSAITMLSSKPAFSYVFPVGRPLFVRNDWPAWVQSVVGVVQHTAFYVILALQCYILEIPPCDVFIVVSALQIVFGLPLVTKVIRSLKQAEDTHFHEHVAEAEVIEDNASQRSSVSRQSVQSISEIRVRQTRTSLSNNERVSISSVLSRKEGIIGQRSSVGGIDMNPESKRGSVSMQSAPFAEECDENASVTQAKSQTQSQSRSSVAARDILG